MHLADGTRVVLDAGSGLRALGQSILAPSRPLPTAMPVVPIALTHRHSDHVMGLAHFAPLLTGSHRVRIACGGVEASVLRDLVRLQLSAPLFPNVDGVIEHVDVDAFDDADTFSISAGCRVRALAANHPGGASVLCVDDAAGLLVAYAPDNELMTQYSDPAMATWRRALAISLRDVPLLLHDATYVDSELPAHRGWGHSSAEEATRFAMECGARTLVLTHHHPDRTDDQIDEIVAQCAALVRESGSSLRVCAAAEGRLTIIT